MLQLPRWLLRKLPPRLRRAVIALLWLLAAGLVVGVVLLAPVIARDKRESERREQARLERNRAAELQRLRREQRPRRGTLAAGAPLASLEAAITADARARVEAGEFPTSVRRTECERLGRKRGLVVASCTAVTSDIPPTAESRGGVVGYPYRAAYDPASRAYAVCKTSGRAGEGSLGKGQQVELPRACGG